jgi:hypothetical protein
MGIASLKTFALEPIAIVKRRRPEKRRRTPKIDGGIFRRGHVPSGLWCDGKNTDFWISVEKSVVPTHLVRSGPEIDIDNGLSIAGPALLPTDNPAETNVHVCRTWFDHESPGICRDAAPSLLTNKD